MFRIFGVNFLKTRNFRMAHLCLKATIFSLKLALQTMDVTLLICVQSPPNLQRLLKKRQTFRLLKVIYFGGVKLIQQNLNKHVTIDKTVSLPIYLSFFLFI